MLKPSSEFEENLYFFLCEKRFNDVLKALKNPENDFFISDNVWNLINLVCQTVKMNFLLENDTDVSLCKKILLFLGNRGNPKEVLVSLLEQADSFKHHEFFSLLLDPLQHTLQKTPGKRGKSLYWVLSTLNAHIETLSNPEDLDLQGEEKLLLDADVAVQDTVYVLSNYLPFIEFFVNEVSFENINDDECYYIDRIYHQREIMSIYVLKLFYRPLLYHDLHLVSESKPKSSVRVLCESYIRCLSKICKNVFNLFQYYIFCGIKEKDVNPLFVNFETKTYSQKEYVDEEDFVHSLAFSNLSYLIFVENMTLDFQPFVYSHRFVFMNNIKYILLLLIAKENLVLFKGLQLAQNLVNRLEDSELNYDYIELEAFTQFSELLLNLAIYCKIKAHRMSSINIFKTYVSKCNSKGQYHLIMQVLSNIKLSAAQGLVINMYKNYLHDALNGSKSAEYFLGKNLNLFLKNVFVLSDNVETDILEYSDKIVNSLNFLRYVLLRDGKEKNSTGIWDLIPFISENYIIPLTTALDLSRAHYKQVIKDAESEIQHKKSVNVTVAVNNETMPPDFKKEIFQKALLAFDVVESILCRVKELM